ncbi:methyltransferase domain-containing protein [Phaeodactylibacter xiamenensis]|uniref:methyltransferase domain-containing protein n=1 Tax=Phaeodactylibacter xiamenensis TaxID=1524460 RepID=UPI0024A9CA7F|nr:methyltransferase domain-containing protein [Phaeodactylibacter xiamenensis]
MSAVRFRVGGVPEHFNYPWYMAGGDHPKFEWVVQPGGTGAMCEGLRSGALDIALLLTEGAVADLHKGNPSQIIGTYVSSPLTWGIHVAAGSPYQSVEDLEGKVFGISRYTSGSHLMAYVNARQLDWDTSALQFEVVGNFEGARQAMQEGRIDAFMWEKYTTKPTVDSGEWRRPGVCVTPWPCFVLVAREEIVEQYQPELLELMHDIRQRLDHTDRTEKLRFISDHFKLQPEDVADWYGQTTWSCAPAIAASELDKVQGDLQALGIIEDPVSPRQLCAPFVTFEEENLSSVMYNWRVDSVYKKLEEEGLEDGPLQLSDLLGLGHLDQYHYLGAEACYEVAEALSLEDSDYVYDVGSGVGGTARVLADCSGCRVLGVELQPELCRLSTELTRRAGLSDRVEFRAGDLLNYDWEGTFDHFISLLVFLHVPDRTKVLAHCHKALKPGGRFFIEDFVVRNPLSSGEARQLKETVSAQSVSNTEVYLQALEQAGFTDLEVVEMDTLWREWTKKRFDEFKDNQEAHRSFYGEALFENRLSFYQTIADLFAGGNLGGVRITGRKKS